MSSLFDTIRGALDPSTVQQISSQIGSDPQTTQRAITAALPMVLGGMASHASSGGEGAIQSAVQSPEAQQAATTVTEPGVAPPPAHSGLLGALLGQHNDAVQQKVSQTSGLDPHQAGKLLLILAPIVIGVLARRQEHADSQQPAQQSAQQPTSSSPGGLASILQQATGAAQQHATQAIPGLGQVLGSLFGH